jgi:hypothetical protein
MEAALHARSFLAAERYQPLSENSRLGHQLPTAILYPGVGFVNSNTATGLDVFACTTKAEDLVLPAKNGSAFFGKPRRVLYRAVLAIAECPGIARKVFDSAYDGSSFGLYRSHSAVAGAWRTLSHPKRGEVERPFTRRRS